MRANANIDYISFVFFFWEITLIISEWIVNIKYFPCINYHAVDGEFHKGAMDEIHV